MKEIKIWNVKSTYVPLRSNKDGNQERLARKSGREISQRSRVLARGLSSRLWNEGSLNVVVLFSFSSAARPRR